MSEMDMALGIGGETNMLISYDLGTESLQVEPVLDRTTETTKDALLAFTLGQIPKRFYSDGAPEFIRAAKELGWKTHDRPKPGDPQGN